MPLLVYSLTSSSPEAVLTESILWQRPTLASVCMFMLASVSRRLKAGEPGSEGGGGTVAVFLTRFKLKVSTIRALRQVTVHFHATVEIIIFPIKIYTVIICLG